MTSRTTILTVVWAVATITIASIVVVAYLTAVNQPVPDAINPIPFGGLTGLLGLLASTRSGLGENEKEPSMAMVPSSAVSVTSGTPGSGAAGTGAMPGSSAPPLEVTVTNPPSDPVPVEPAPVNTRRP